MGSLCARVYAGTFGNELSGLILCGTAQVPLDLNFFIDILDKATAKFGPRKVNHTMASMLNKVSSLQISDRTSDLDWLSINKENVQEYIADPLCGQELSLAGIRDLASIAILACDKMWPTTIPFNLPIMIIGGALDPVGMNGKGVLAVADSLAGAGIEPTTILYPGMRHEILNETDNDVVFKDVLSFLLSIYTKEV
jgi:alpha-beta hydrolase superfamily lysophospholipase